MVMSFTRIIYSVLIPKKITLSLTELSKALSFIKDLTDGKYIERIEKQEFEKFELLAQCIDKKEKLLPLLRVILNGNRGSDIKNALLQHRILIHALYYNKNHIIGEMSQLIDELELQVLIQEKAMGQGYSMVIRSDQSKR